MRWRVLVPGWLCLAALTTDPAAAAGSLPEAVRTALADCWVASSTEVVGDPAHLEVARAFVRTTGRKLGALLPRVTPDEQSALVTLAGTEFGGPELLQLSTEVVEQCNAGDLPLSTVMPLFHVEGRHHGFVSVNYQSERLASALTKLRDSGKLEPTAAEFVGSVLSGESYREFERHFKFYGLPVPAPVKPFDKPLPPALPPYGKAASGDARPKSVLRLPHGAPLVAVAWSAALGAALVAPRLRQRLRPPR